MTLNTDTGCRVQNYESGQLYPSCDADSSRGVLRSEFVVRGINSTDTGSCQKDTVTAVEVINVVSSDIRMCDEAPTGGLLMNPSDIFRILAIDC
jgi:hypothetical protein